MSFNPFNCNDRTRAFRVRGDDWRCWRRS